MQIKNQKQRNLFSLRANKKPFGEKIEKIMLANPETEHHLAFPSSCSDDVRELTFTVIIDMRGSTWTTVKPILKVLNDFAGQIHTAYIIKPDGFWQKQRTSLGSQKYNFEVSEFPTATRFTFWEVALISRDQEGENA